MAQAGAASAGGVREAGTWKGVARGERSEPANP